MMEKELKNLINNHLSFGNFNAILCFKNRLLEFNLLYEEIKALFNPKKVEISLFDLDNFEMKEIDVSASFKNKNAIRKVIFIHDEEKIILEHYKEFFLIEHLFRFDNFHSLKQGKSVIEKYLSKEIDSKLIMGFELSIHINSLVNSVEENIEDASLHPIITLTNVNNKLKKEIYNFENNKISDQKIKLIEQYIYNFR